MGWMSSSLSFYRFIFVFYSLIDTHSFVRECFNVSLFSLYDSYLYSSERTKTLAIVLQQMDRLTLLVLIAAASSE